MSSPDPPVGSAAVTLYATCATGLGTVLAEELLALGLGGVRRAGAGARFGGGLEAAYRACLHSRVASRVLWPLHEGRATTPEALYALAREVDWERHVEVDGTLAVDAFVAGSTITHSRHAALTVKDAIVDAFRERHGRRPDVDRERPDLRVNLYVFRDRARLAVDLAGEALHRRGYREDGGPAPLRENLAAALLLAAGWPERVEAGEPFADPLCGSGTLLIEAATIACRRAPGLGRERFGFLRWKGHDGVLWARLLDEARARLRPAPVPIAGSDRDPEAIARAARHAARAGVGEALGVERRALGEGRARVLADAGPGLLLSNPPYGARLAAADDFYAVLGRALARDYGGWHCGLLVACAAPLARARLPLVPRLALANGGIDCVYAEGRIPSWRGRAGARDAREAGPGAAADPPAVDVEPFVNRLRKNLRALAAWRRREGIRAFRAYDADLPDFAVAIDVHDTLDGARHVVVQEYRAPSSVNPARARARREALVAALPALLDVAPTRVHVKLRERQRGGRQYERRERGASVVARLEEEGRRLELNFSDYLDTGLFLDHRPVRREIARRAAGARFLNLFAYTGAATVAAVAGGAARSVSVDLSRRYSDWARRNLALNGADAERHRVVRADAMSWLREAPDEAPFDLILLDPPTHSSSRARELDWDVQRDHATAIALCLERLERDGLLMFSNNFRRFRLDPTLAAGRSGAQRLRVTERPRAALDPDFRRGAQAHRCWFIRKCSS